MADRDRNQDRRRAAGIALAAAGATALYDRMRRRSSLGGGSIASAASTAEFATGRGTPRGPVDGASHQAGYELADTNVRSLVIVMIVAIVLMIVGLTAVFSMYAGFDRHSVARTATDTAEQRMPIVPPLPHLQADPYKEIDATQTEQMRRLTSYGWTKADHTSAHIPIERAMRQVVGKTLDATATADAIGPAGTDQPMPSLPAFRAAIPENKPANVMPGEGRPGAIAPSYDPKKDGPP